ncbi:MAG TPA: diguanylate cyclase [Candidatus Paceibacterota bacterium]|nr:diguanylate cyclase [Candidatus Paceibacterota bacterium]
MRSHDGLRDSLTHLASPGLFYEELRREIARVRRSGDLISLAKFALRSDVHGAGDPRLREFDIEVLSFSHTLSRLTRAEDMCSRIGSLEFLVLLHGSDSVAMALIERVAVAWIGDLAEHAGTDYQCRVTLENSHLPHIAGESALEFLNRLDQKVRTADIPL